MEHRCGQRISTDVPVSLIALPAAIGAGRILNVSSTGAFIQTDLALPLLSLVYLEAGEAPRGVGVSGRFAAFVVRQCASGVGVEWCDAAPDWTLLEAIERHGNSAAELAHQL
jgi:hypothetical protein